MRVLVLGSKGLVGRAVMRACEARGDITAIGVDRAEEGNSFDLGEPNQAWDAIWLNKPDVVVLAAAKVGGIKANSEQPADFIHQNLSIQTNVIRCCLDASVSKLVFLGSSCIYPRGCPQPMHERHLLTGPLEETNKPYAVAKIAGITMCQAFNKQYGTNNICLMPTNLYGPHDNFSSDASHVVPAMMRKIHKAKQTSKPPKLWGTGKPLRELMHVDDLADAILLCIDKYDAKGSSDCIINVGTGHEISISKLADFIAASADYHGKITFDPSMPDGTPRKLLDSSKIQKLGWKPRIPLPRGIHTTYRWFLENCT